MRLFTIHHDSSNLNLSNVDGNISIVTLDFTSPEQNYITHIHMSTQSRVDLKKHLHHGRRLQTPNTHETKGRKLLTNHKAINQRTQAQRMRRTLVRHIRERIQRDKERNRASQEAIKQTH